MAGGANCEITLRQPPPLDTPLSRVEGRICGPDGSMIAEVTPIDGIDVVVPPISHAAAERASTAYAGFVEHPFPTCYVCGTDRPDGLRIFAGRLPDGTTAASWTVPDDVSVATVWAALDCPSGWAVIGEGRPYVLGRIAVVVRGIPEPGDACVVRGMSTGAEGRKAFAYSTLYGADGLELARARATWIAIAG
jgi:hypothetical protein